MLHRARLWGWVCWLLPSSFKQWERRVYRTTFKTSVIFCMFFVLFLLSCMEDYHSYALTAGRFAQWRHLLTYLKSLWQNWFFSLALFASDKSLAICVFLQVRWHSVSISVLHSCDSCVSEVADRLTETVRTLNISTQKLFFGRQRSFSWEINFLTIISAQVYLTLCEILFWEKDSVRHSRPLLNVFEWVCACSCTGGLRFSWSA